MLQARGCGQRAIVRQRIVDHAVKNLGLDPDKVLINIDRYGNTSSASIPICLAEARRSGANLPVTALVDQFYSEVEKMGGKRWDTSSLIARLDR